MTICLIFPLFNTFKSGMHGESSSEPDLSLHPEVPVSACGEACTAKIIVHRITIQFFIPVHVGDKETNFRSRFDIEHVADLECRSKGQFVEISLYSLICVNISVIVVGSAVRIEIHILPRGFVKQREVLSDGLGGTKVECGPVITVATAVAIFTVLCNYRRRDFPVFDTGRMPYDANLTDMASRVRSPSLPGCRASAPRPLPNCNALSELPGNTP